MTIFDVIRYKLSNPVQPSEIKELPEDVYRAFISIVEKRTVYPEEEHDLIFNLLLNR